MKPYKSLLPHPDDMSDEAATVLTEFLFYLANACELRYGAKIRRYTDIKRAAEIDRLDPDHPWTRPPPPA
jgi:hypothetical protein